MDDPDIGHPINNSIWPHLCGICRSPHAKKCAGCKSFSFCGKDHQLKAWYRHKRVCKFLKEMQSEEMKEELGGEFDGPIGLNKRLLLWKVFQEMNPSGDESIEKRVRRNIEKNQVMHVPACLGCGKLPPLSIVCQCRTVAFCSTECEGRCKNEDGPNTPKHPVSTCQKFQETTKALPILKEHGWSPGSVSSVGKKVDLVQISEQVKLENQESGTYAISNYVPNSTWKAYFDKVKVYLPGVTSGSGVSMNTYVDPALANVIADGLSNSLTICYALSKMKLKYSANGTVSSDPNVRPLANKDNIFTIHVIGAEEDWQGFAAFEEVLHRCLFNGRGGVDAILPSNCKGLRVFFIGPELKGAGSNTSGHREEFLCDHCKSKGMKFFMGFRQETYEDFVKNDLLHENCNLLPDVLVGYNCGIHDNSQVRQEVRTEQVQNDVDNKGVESLKISYTSAWEKCIELICESPNNIFDDIPFILTGYDCRESREDQKVVCSFSKGSNALMPTIGAEENPYQSPLWQSESAWFQLDDMPVVYGHNFALTALQLQRGKGPSK